ncbi:hypothetical protein [Flavobacterium sp. MDT1-60]|uniref:hypothetical protein n=1 Tax=Flavobacterium sp. MDT1-60 TaxID=1979344 RepID=UPI00177D297C|nr:hypothetical protein [Flavobacterium sp. MDT1-60]QOG02858.1 hypothetical protein IHE43_01035 [Flavobacterium sp. MDT1-60]
MKTVALILLSLFSTFIAAQENPKDTLFFSYDKNYIRTYVKIPNHFYLKDSNGTNNGAFYFTEVKTLENQKIKSKEICLRKFVRSSKYFDKNTDPKLNDYELWKYLRDYFVFLVKEVDSKKKYIQVKSSYEIE